MKTLNIHDNTGTRWLLILFLFLYLHGSAFALKGVDHSACKTCHERVVVEAFGMPYRHSVVDERCGLCHVKGGGTKSEGKTVSFSGFNRESLVPLKGMDKEKPYLIEVVARDKLGRKSPRKELRIAPASEVNHITAIKPEIFDINVDEIKSDVFYEAALSWRTNVYTISRIEYGGDKNYGSLIDIAGAYAKEHTVTIPALNGKNVYHYRIIAENVFGNTVVSSDNIFNTYNATASDNKESSDRAMPRIDTLDVLSADRGMYLFTSVNKPSRIEIKIMEIGEVADKHTGGFLPPARSHISVCVECHPQGISHPVGVSSKSVKTHTPKDLPTLDGGIITCVTCHLPHGGEKKYFSRLDFERDLCIQCHREDDL